MEIFKNKIRINLVARGVLWILAKKTLNGIQNLDFDWLNMKASSPDMAKEIFLKTRWIQIF